MLNAELRQHVDQLLETEIYPSLFSDAKPQERPQGFVIGGQPGAGKSATRDEVIRQMEGNVIPVDVDKFRKHHPHIQEIHARYGKYDSAYTHEFACYIADKVFEKALEGNYNIVVESTFRSAEAPLAKLQSMKARGYQTGVAMVAVSAEESWQGVVDRFEKQMKKGYEYPRFTPKSYHDSVIDHIAVNANIVQQSGLADTFIINDRQGNRLYDQAINHEPPGDALLSVINRNKENTLSPDSAKVFADIATSFADRLVTLQQDNEAGINIKENKLAEIRDNLLFEQSKGKMSSRRNDAPEPD